MLRQLSKPLRVLLALIVCVLVAAVCFQPTVDAFKLGEYTNTLKQPGLSQRLANEYTAKKKLLKRELSEEDDDDEYEGEQMSAEADNSMEATESQEDEDGFVFRKVSKSTHVIKKRESSASNEASEEQDDVKPKSSGGFFDALKFWKSAASEEEIETAEEEASCTDKPAEPQGYPLFQWLKDYIKRKKSDSGEDDTSAEQSQEEATSSEDKSSFLSSVMDTVNVFKSTVSKAATVVSETASENLKFSLFDEDNEPPPPKPVISYEQFQKLLLQLPSFVPNYTNIFNIDCKRQGQIFERQLRAHKTWTLQLMDANAKLPSGILRGNINQLGDFDQCLGIATKIKVTEDQSIRFRGKYCLAHIELQPKDDDLRAPVNALHGKGALRSNFKDPNHFLPRFTTANWGLCVPSSCSTGDAELILQKFLKPYNTSLGIKLIVEVNEGNCVLKGSNKGWIHFFMKNWKTTTSVFIFALLGSITFLATLDDFWALSNLNTIFQKEPATVEGEGEAKPEAESAAEPIAKAADPEEPAPPGMFKQIFHAFSMKRNVPALVEVNLNPDATVPNFACVHGIRAMATMALFLALKFIPLGKIPYSNRYALTELFNWPISVVLRAVFLYMETFLVVNGLLAGYGMSKEFRERGKINVGRRLIGRILRLAPALGATLLFYSFIWEHLGDGPQWNDVVTTNADLCKRNWWQNMFFIQNWFPVERMCATHTFQLSIELQLYALLPLLIWLLYKHPDRGLGVLCAIIGLSTAARYSSIADNRLSLLVFHGMKLSQIYRTMNFSYASVLHRVTSYLVGAGVGILMQEEENRPKERIFTTLSKGFIQIGWISSFYCMFWLFWTQTELAGKHFQYDPNAAAQYGALAPLLWSLSVCWIVYACNNGCGDWLNRVLSSRPLVLVSRLSYAMCLIQFLVFFYTVGVTRDTEIFGLAALFNRSEVVCLVSGALLLTLFVDMPVQNLKRIFFAAREEESVATPDTDKATMEKAVEDDFKSPFDGRDEDDFGARPVFRSRQASLEQADPILTTALGEGKDDSETESADHFWDRRHQDRTDVVDSIKDALEDEEEEEEEEEEEPEEEEEKPKPQNGGPQKIRWRWDVQEN